MADLTDHHERARVRRRMGVRTRVGLVPSPRLSVRGLRHEEVQAEAPYRPLLGRNSVCQ